MENLQLISKFNGEELDLNLRDVRDHFGTITSPRGSLSHPATSPVRGRSEEVQPFLTTASSSVIFDVPTERGDETTKVAGSSPDSANYNTTGETDTIKNNAYPYTTPTLDFSTLPTAGSRSTSPALLRGHSHQRLPTGHSITGHEEDDERKVVPRQRRSSRVPRSRRSSVSVSYKSMSWLPRFIRKPLWAYLDRISLVLAPEWIGKTLTVWAVWFSMALGMFPW
jgi:hypothetical protein